MLHLANRFAELGHDVDMVLCRGTGNYLHRLDPRVSKQVLDVPRMVFAGPALARYARRRRPTVIISALYHADLVLLVSRILARLPSKVLISAQNNPEFLGANGAGGRNRLIGFGLRRLLRRADGIVAISRGVGESLVRLACIDRESVVVIHNPVVAPGFERERDAEPQHPWFTDNDIPVLVAAGRLTPQKDYPTLLHAFTILRQRRPLRLIILGEGEDRRDLEALVRSLSIEEDVDMPGFAENPYAFMKAADLFVLSSRFEGFANVLAEALACGTPVVSTDCPYGPSEILANGKYGRSVPVGDAEAFADAMNETLDEPREPDRLIRRGYEFSIEPIADAYLHVLRQIGALPR
mgnify:CR=1 FL=1